MRKGRGWWAGIAFVVLALLVLVWLMPARWVVPRLASRMRGIRLEQVHGSLWDGEAGRLLTADGRSWGHLHWQLSRRALLGELRLRWALKGPGLDFSGGLQRLASDRIEWHGVQLQVDLDALEPLPATSLGRPLGQLHLQVPHALLQDHWPMQLQATGQWQHASMRTADGSVTLGSLRFEARGKQGMIHTQMHDDGQGPLALDGRLALSPLGWQLDATLRPRGDEPALRHWLAGLGRPDAAGTVHLQRRGGLAAALPAQEGRP